MQAWTMYGSGLVLRRGESAWRTSSFGPAAPHHSARWFWKITLDDDRRVVVSEELSGSAATQDWMTRFHGGPHPRPRGPRAHRPDPAFLA